MKKKNKGNANVAPVTWAQCVRDIINHSTNKGTLFPLLVFLFFLIPIFKLDSVDSAKFINGVMNSLCNYSLLGWLLFVVTIVTWAIVAKKVRKSYSNFMKIAGNEKTKVQQQLNPDVKLGSSDRS